jgi:hypothetical protein
MPPRRTQQQHQAEDAARKLQTLLHSGPVRQLLQQAPAAQLTLQQLAQITTCYQTMQQLVNALKRIAEAADAGPIVAAVILQHKACYSAGMLVVWLLGVPQQPQQRQQQQQQHRQQQQLPLGFLPQEDVMSSALSMLWQMATTIVSLLCRAVQDMKPRAAVSEAALQLTEQLEQAGELLPVTCGNVIPAVASALSACKTALHSSDAPGVLQLMRFPFDVCSTHIQSQPTICTGTQCTHA